MTRARETTSASPTDAVASTASTAVTPKRRGRPPGISTPKQKKGTCISGSAEARQKAYVIVETLSGLRSPSEASALIGVTINRYYQLEWRALQGLVDALEVRPAGRQPSPEVDAKRLERERHRLERELRRAQALVRVAQRTVGLPAPPPPARDVPGDGKKRRRGPRNRTARTLARIRTPERATAGATPTPPASAT